DGRGTGTEPWRILRSYVVSNSIRGRRLSTTEAVCAVLQEIQLQKLKNLPDHAPRLVGVFVHDGGVRPGRVVDERQREIPRERPGGELVDRRVDARRMLPAGAQDE